MKMKSLCTLFSAPLSKKRTGSLGPTVVVVVVVVLDTRCGGQQSRLGLAKHRASGKREGRRYRDGVEAKVVELGLRGAQETQRERGVDVIERHGLGDLHPIRLQR